MIKLSTFSGVMALVNTLASLILVFVGIMMTTVEGKGDIGTLLMGLGVWAVLNSFALWAILME